MADIKSPRLLYAKAALFVLCGTMASGLILVEMPTVKVALLLGIAILVLCQGLLLRVLRHPALHRSKLQVRGALVVCFLCVAETGRERWFLTAGEAGPAKDCDRWAGARMLTGPTLQSGGTSLRL